MVPSIGATWTTRFSGGAWGDAGAARSPSKSSDIANADPAGIAAVY
jgi:hypothetical protein